jgi:valyl-tRNA synthetase
MVGTGIVMCCTFGDQTDMEWQKIHDLPIRIAITEDGKMTELAQKYAGLTIKEARRLIIKDLKENQIF